jgi:D-psicose/D-tagatose/L-ribulose 3-epimerase
VVDRDLSITCGTWRDTWKDNVALARRAKAFSEERFASAGAK